MHYYQFNIADYRKDTGHLSNLEHGIYRQLLDWYYLDEAPIPKENRTVIRRLRLGSQDEINALENVLSEFFALADDGYTHGRCDSEIEQYHAKVSTNQANGKKGGRPKKPRNNPEITQSVILANPTETQGEPNQKATINHKPLTNNQYEVAKATLAADKQPTCPHLEIIELFGRHLPELPQPKPELWTGKRQRDLTARWRWVLTAKKKNGDRYAETTEDAISWFARYFEYVKKSDFLMGRQGNWSCDLGWLVNAENFTKVVQGNYENKQETEQ